jgi:hypothetical protein
LIGPSQKKEDWNIGHAQKKRIIMVRINFHKKTTVLDLTKFGTPKVLSLREGTSRRLLNINLSFRILVG